NEVRQKEFDLELDTDKPYVAFQYRVERVKNELHDLLVKLKKEGKRDGSMPWMSPALPGGLLVRRARQAVPAARALHAIHHFSAERER
ncbi:MAG TPA: hypothetical protein VL242_21520, partial [Sorangium sp.]|nr:hypothetical protein [Sorangium sp.]